MSDGASSNPPQQWAEHLLRVPFVLTFLLSAWGLFLGLVRGNGWIPDFLRPHVGFVVETWRTDPLTAALPSAVGLVVQHSWGQIVYVTLLLLLFGVAYELRAGWLRTLVVFVGSSVAGLALLLMVLTGAYLSGAQEWTGQLARVSWSGASVGSFGLLGALIATSQHRAQHLATWASFVVFVEWTLVPGLAVAMHVAGFAFGFAFAAAARAASPSPAAHPDAIAEPLED